MKENVVVYLYAFKMTRLTFFRNMTLQRVEFSCNKISALKYITEAFKNEFQLLENLFIRVICYYVNTEDHSTSQTVSKIKQIPTKKKILFN